MRCLTLWRPRWPLGLLPVFESAMRRFPVSSRCQDRILYNSKPHSTVVELRPTGKDRITSEPSLFSFAEPIRKHEERDSHSLHGLHSDDDDNDMTDRPPLTTMTASDISFPQGDLCSTFAFPSGPSEAMSTRERDASKHA